VKHAVSNKDDETETADEAACNDGDNVILVKVEEKSSSQSEDAKPTPDDNQVQNSVVCVIVICKCLLQ